MRSRNVRFRFFFSDSMASSIDALRIGLHSHPVRSSASRSDTPGTAAPGFRSANGRSRAVYDNSAECTEDQGFTSTVPDPVRWRTAWSGNLIHSRNPFLVDKATEPTIDLCAEK